MLSRAARNARSAQDASDDPSKDVGSESEDEPLAALESTDEEGEEFGEFGEPYTLPERRIIGKCISQHSKSKWVHMSSDGRWQAMDKKVCTAKSSLALFWIDH